MSLKRRILIATAPFSLFLYLSVCFLSIEFGNFDGKIWLYALPIFLLNGIIPVLLGFKKLTFSVSFVITILYLILGFVSTAMNHPLWHPGWVIFLLIPVIHALIGKPTSHN